MTRTLHPGKDVYPDLKTPLIIDGVGEHESPRIKVKDGFVIFSRWDEDIDDRVSFTISEWDFGNFVDQWSRARIDQRLK